jgi:predicted component of viral defense system (DUF524 family)
MYCKVENCDLKKEIHTVSENAREFQRNAIDNINSFKMEVRDSLKNIDDRYARMYEHLEKELRSEMIQRQDALNAKVDSCLISQNNRSLTIMNDLGDIKLALGLKADRDETSQLQSSIMKKFEVESEKAAKERIEMERQANKIGYKLLFFLIGLISSAFASLLIQYLSNN